MSKCGMCGEKVRYTRALWVTFAGSVFDPDLGQQQGLTYSEKLDLCAGCRDSGSARPYRGRFYRPHLMKIYHPEAMYDKSTKGET